MLSLVQLRWEGCCGRAGGEGRGMPVPAGFSVLSVLKAVCYAGRRLWAFEGLNTIF